MKTQRTKNAVRNIIFGVILKTYQILIPFVMRTLLIYFLGIEYLGLNSLFVSVLQVLNLAELGVGSAMVYSMYKPIAEDNVGHICALMKLYKIYYRVIGFVVLAIGLILLPFIPNLISGHVPPDMNIYVLYLLNLIATVFSYWLFAYKASIIHAYQRVDISSKVTIIVDTIKYIFQILALIVLRNYYYYVIVVLLSQMLSNILISIIADKMYPKLQPYGELSKIEKQKINKRIRDLFTSKLGSVIVNSVDTIVISSFLGLTILAIYQNYFFIITSVAGFISIIFSSITAGVGNSLVVDSEVKNYRDFRKLTFIIAWITSVCTTFFLCLFQPFMELWVGKDLMLEFSVVICFCIYFFITQINTLLNLYKDAAGLWHEDRFRPLITALVNLILNLLTVNTLGIYGVILSTVVSMLFVGMPWLIYNLFSVLFKKSRRREYIKLVSTYSLLTVCVSFITYWLSSFVCFSGYVHLIAIGFICCIVPNMLLWLFYHKTEAYLDSYNYTYNIVRKRR